MAKKKSSWKFKNVGISVGSQVIRRLPKNPKNMNGMKKGQGQLPSGNPAGASEGLEFASMLLSLVEVAPAIEDITDEVPVTGTGQDSSSADASDPTPLPEDDPAAQQSDERYVKGAHLISKKQIDATDFEELWIYRIDPNTPEQAGTILKSILAGTDIPENKSRSDDGKQSYSIWTAGNAQYIHITGLSN